MHSRIAQIERGHKISSDSGAGLLAKSFLRIFFN